jgi:hypothetical protein
MAHHGVNGAKVGAAEVRYNIGRRSCSHVNVNPPWHPLFAATEVQISACGQGSKRVLLSERLVPGPKDRFAYRVSTSAHHISDRHWGEDTRLGVIDEASP